jgi:hypothetical protein
VTTAVEPHSALSKMLNNQEVVSSFSNISFSEYIKRKDSECYTRSD